jgi:hypothetical protein
MRRRLSRYVFQGLGHAMPMALLGLRLVTRQRHPFALVNPTAYLL